MEDELLMQDKAKITDFLNKADSGEVAAGLSSKQKEKVNQYVVEQRNKYVNAAFAAGGGQFQKNSPAYIESIEQMNQVKANLSNLASQQKSMAANQQQYLDDFQSDRISRANYDPSSPPMLADVYTGNAELSIDENGNLMFGKDNIFKKYSDIADYSLKSTDSANSLLNIADKLAASHYQVPNASLKLYKNRVKSMVDKGGRNVLMSLMQDDLLPGFGDLNVPKDLYKRENYSQLKDYFLQTMNSALDSVNNSLPKNPKFNKTGSGTPGTGGGDGKIGNKTLEERKAILKAADSLLSRGRTIQGDETFKFTYKGSNDANSTKYEMRAVDGKLVYRVDSPDSEYVPISNAELQKELGFADNPTLGMTAQEKIKYYNNKQS